MHYAVIALQAAHGGSGNHRSGVLAMPCNDWLMKRNCSLSPRQVGWFYLSIVCFSLAIALFFAWRGAWLVLPFAGMELAGLGVALLVYARHATDYERVTLANGRLVVETASGGRVTRQELNPHWVRVELGESAPALVVLRSGRQTVQVGCFLDPYSRRKFARELVAALRRQ
ncbi:putative membrane protein [Cupriavidus gilardii J11]|uniref:Putative membrane protein n=1 Tax=Cupriavidus gilardii J11 TaxID=936133 RepID=A0A562BF85_9BURK|nr:putative membrane protein [Cupriavidus gilardii J11]